MKIRVVAFCAITGVALLVNSCSLSKHENVEQVEVAPSPSKEEPNNSPILIASIYSESFKGKETANGERFDPNSLTVAHRTYAFGTNLKLTNVENGRSVTVRVNDRGPFVKGRSFDITPGVARALGSSEDGVIKVRVEKVS